jgi:PAS domain S-box-containing protein
MRQRGGSEQPVKGRRANKPKARTISAPSAADLQKQVGILTREAKEAQEQQATAASQRSSAADLRKQLDQRTRELTHTQKLLTEALQQQTATADVLKVISRSAFDLQSVLDALLTSACRLCEADIGTIRYEDGNNYRLAATYGFKPEWIEHFSRYSTKPDRSSIFGQTILDGHTVHIPDVLADPDYKRPAAQKLIGFRAALGVPLVDDGHTFGVISLFRFAVGSFEPKQVQIGETFADQAVIAIKNVRLFEEVQAKTRDLTESLQQQTATSEVLQVIGSSLGDLTPVFDKMLENATRVCGAKFGSMYLVEDDSLRQAALYNAPPAFAAARANKVFRPHPLGTMATAIRTKQMVQVADVRTTRAYLERIPYAIELAELGGARTVVNVPMLRDQKVIGAITIYRQEVRPFADKQIELLSNFAKQAVIAIENARLLTETREALERQTATAEVLQVINSSPGDLAPVFETILEKAHRLCGISHGSLQLYDGETFRAVAVHGLSEALAERLRQGFVPSANHPSRPLLEGARFAHVPDWAEIEDPIAQVVVGSGIRTTLSTPLRKDGTLLGTIVAGRQEVRPFSEKEIALLENFAAQAVIAMENARLLGELRERTTDLARSVNELTATGDVLKIISRSSVDLETVLDTLVETVARLCRAEQAVMFRRFDERYQVLASCGLPDEAKDFLLSHPLTPDRGTLSGRVELERRPVHIPDAIEDPEYTYREGQKVVGFRTMLGVPLLRQDSIVGIFSISRTRVEPFTDKEIELATTFADQAVIAIENARLFEELRDRQAELRVTFDNMGDGVVMFGADTRLVAWNRNFQTLLDLPDAFLARRPSYSEYFHYLAERGEYSADLEAELSRRLHDTDQESRLERTRPDGRVIEARRNPVPGGGFVLIYADITERKRAEEQIRTARDAAEKALRELQLAQASLVHAQKMAALGQVTAGIAHEIKNPLNFVNNFAGLSVELLDELKEAAHAVDAIDPGKRAEIVETIRMLTGNLEKIVEHGRRADGIVRSMLQHSRGSSDDRQSTNLNALAEEALNLAYHGARAQDPNFDIALEHDLDSDLAPVDVVPQELTRVLLNLIGNGFYAVIKRGRESDGTYRPALKVTTRDFGESVEVRVRDNGIGIPLENRDKLFQPFFTTKPTGEGTGLGLSISYEIVTQQHGGTITVDSEVGDFTEFTVRLPRWPRAVAG